MGFIGVQPASVPLTASDITNDIINADKIADDSISEEHIDNTAITGFSALTSLADTDKFLVSDASDSNNLKYVEKQYLPSGALVSLGSASSTTNTANVTFDNVFSNTYTRYIIYIDYMYNGQTNTALRFNFRKSDGSGGYEDESRSGYVYAIAGRRHNNDEFDGVGSGSATSFGKLTPEITRSGGEHGLKAVLEVYRPGTVDSQATMTYVQARGMYRSYISDDAQSTHFNSSCNNYYGSTSFLGIKLYFSGGDIDNYKIRLYGVVT